MKERIETLIEKESLNLARFADLVGLNRSALSHILSGRNKPSLDVVTKILQTFPRINSDWLLFGKGEIYLDSVDTGTAQSLFSEVNQISHEPIASKAQSTPSASLFSSPVLPSPGIVSSERKIAKIMIFYSDNTFETITPAEKATNF
ncbi:MAG: helix-turn-helix domain-containing protein [Bacteroidales bacterium]